MTIRRQSLREQIRQEVLARLERGEFDLNSPINEVRLAEELGVSRTPLREALIALENEGVISSESGKGFRFVPLSVQEFEELMPVLAELEVLALRSCDPAALQAVAPRLLAKAVDFDVDAAEHVVITRLDDEWHDQLLSPCPNGRLMDLITTLKVALHRYERILVGDEEILVRSAAEHREIARRLLAGDVPGATEALRVNWANGARRLLDNFEAHRV